MSPIPTSEKRPFIPAPGCAQIEAIYTCLGQRCENVYHILQGDGATQPTDAQKHAIASVIEQWEHDNAIGYRHNGCQLSLVRVRDLNEAAGVAVEITPSLTVTGLVTGVRLPNNVTAAVKWSTALAGRSFRGRTYHIGMPATLVTDQALNDSGKLGIRDSYNLLRTRLEAVAGVQLVVLSYAHAKFWRDAALATHIIGVSVDPNLDSQRRRLTGRGQ